MRRRDVLALGLSSLSLPLLSPRAAHAQGTYPDQPIRFIVPRSAGGVVDVAARLWADRVRPQLGNIIIENQGGGGGVIAAAAVARSRPDGYTLLAGTTSELIISPIIFSTAGYDPIKDLTPIALTAVSVSSLMVHGALPVKTLKELVAYAKANPGKLTYGSAGVGTSAHLCAELFKQIAGLPDIVHVPYKGANPGLTDFFSGRLPMFASSINPTIIQMHRDGKIRVLVAGNSKKLESAPEIPTNAEAGFPELVTVNFIGVFAPGATPKPVIDKVASVTRAITTDKDFQQKLVAAGYEPLVGMGPPETAKFVQEELTRWTPLLKASGIKFN
jgi:tripartite-type tricarboxylate transporter receptor subunit TctC